MDLFLGGDFEFSVAARSDTVIVEAGFFEKAAERLPVPAEREERVVVLVEAGQDCFVVSSDFERDFAAGIEALVEHFESELFLLDVFISVSLCRFVVFENAMVFAVYGASFLHIKIHPLLVFYSKTPGNCTIMLTTRHGLSIIEKVADRGGNTGRKQRI